MLSALYDPSVGVLCHLVVDVKTAVDPACVKLTMFSFTQLHWIEVWDNTKTNCHSVDAHREKDSMVKFSCIRPKKNFFPK